jgi:hypothetical protein
MRARRSHLDAIGEAAFLDQVAKDALGRGRAADVAGADDEDADGSGAHADMIGNKKTKALFPIAMTSAHRALLAALLSLASFQALAQDVVRNDEDLGSTRPEAWAMNYMTASTLMTSFGEAPVLAPWQWRAALDVGHIPSLDDSQRRVGFLGTKEEDLNKSPVFGRIRVMLGLPAGFVVDVGYTPEVRLRGSQPRELFAVALGRKFYERDHFTFSMRAFGQHGRAHGDITCPGRLANAPLAENPYGCREPSDDRIVMNYYGVDATTSWSFRPWQAYATLGYARTELEVQVDALTFDFRDRSLLTARGSWPFLAVGARHDIDRNWSLGFELLYVPLRVQREIDGATERDPFTGIRLQLAYRFG